MDSQDFSSPGASARIRALCRELRTDRVSNPKPHGYALQGEQFSRLLVLEECTERSRHGSIRWRCLCDCGQETIVTTTRLVRGEIQSCGCLRRDHALTLPRPQKQHPWVGHPLYRVWAGIQRRCENPNDKSYRYYGARGVRMCTEWRKHPELFITWATMNGWTYSKRWVISRFGDVGHYSPENCALIPKSENSRQPFERKRWKRQPR